MLSIAKLPIIYCKQQFIRQLHSSLINFEIIIITSCYGNYEKFQKGVPLTSKISMLEMIFSKIPRKLELDSKDLFWATAREVLFEYLMHE